MDVFANWKDKLKRMKQRVWQLVFFIKLFEIVAMTVCLGLAMDSIANNAIANWSAIEIVFVANVVYILVNAVSLIYHASRRPMPSFLLVASPVVGVALFTFIGSHVFEFWNGLSLMLAHEATAALCITRGIHQLKLVAIICSGLATVFGIDTILTMLSRPGHRGRDERQVVAYKTRGYEPKNYPAFKRLIQ